MFILVFILLLKQVVLIYSLELCFRIALKMSFLLLYSQMILSKLVLSCNSTVKAFKTSATGLPGQRCSV
jgi:hypothetical protein